MKKQRLAKSCPLSLFFFLWIPFALAANTESNSTDLNNGHPYSQLITAQAGPYKPTSLSFSNWNNNRFTYSDDSLRTALIELSWGIDLFKFKGTALSFSPGLAYSTFSTIVPRGTVGVVGNTTVSLHLFSFDMRLSQSWQKCPIRSLIPFWEAGALYSLYTQNGVSDYTAGEGTTANFVAALGVRWWINSSSAMNSEFPDRYSELPIFVSLKLNQIFSNGTSFDLGSTNALAGLAIGL